MKKRKVYDVWKNYDEFIRSLHLQSLEEQKKNKKKQIINYAIKLLIVFIGSFFTTLTFSFLINPNKLFNSGINGIIQVLNNYFCLVGNVSESKKTLIYYGIVFSINLLLTSLVHVFYPENIEINSTAIFYVIFQIIWSQIFEYFSLDKYLFSKFNPASWIDLSSKKQLAFTLPYYGMIAILSSMIHTYGYSLIYQAKATPGGLEIITSFLSQQNKKNKISVSYFNKIFGFFIVFLITMFNFLIVEDNIILKRNQLFNEINESNIFVEKISNESDLDESLYENFINDKNGENYEEKLKFFEKWSSDPTLKTEPENIFKHLDKASNVLKYFYEKLKDEHDRISEEEKNKIRDKIKEIKSNNCEKSVLGYIGYATNDEKLLGSIVYILCSSYLINQIFPKSKFVSLDVEVKNKENLNKVLSILNDYDPIYSKISYWNNNDSEQEKYIVKCIITKWNCQLLSEYISQFGKFSTKLIDESN